MANAIEQMAFGLAVVVPLCMLAFAFGIMALYIHVLIETRGCALLALAVAAVLALGYVVGGMIV